MPRLVIHKGTSFFREVVFLHGPLVLIGRTRPADILLPDESRRVSRHHAAIVRTTGGGFFVRDLGSLRGTRVAGRPIQQHRLADGDVIDVGDYRLVYSSHTPTIDQLPPLRVVPKVTDRAFLDGSTAHFTDRDTVREISFTRRQRELVDSLLVHTRRVGSPQQLAAEVVPALVVCLEAVRGFAAAFRTDVPGFDAAGRTGFGPGDQIDIATGDFLDRLAGMQCVFESGVLLAPIGVGSRASGFWCLQRGSHAAPFHEHDGRFLIALGNLVMSARCDAPPAWSGGGAALAWDMELVGSRASLEPLIARMAGAAAGEAHVLLVGDSGTGKELVARAIHAASGARGPFIARNCAAVPESLAEAEIFGHAPKSGIAGADPDGAPGWFELADGGTLLLDEIHALAPSVQDKLLRVLQQREVVRLRGRRAVPVSVKVLAATDLAPEDALATGRLRAPLYYRFGTRIDIPPLRRRREDIALLAYAFLDRQAARLGTPPAGISHRAIQALIARPWPGNVRELEHAIVEAAARASGRDTLFSWDFPFAPTADRASSARKPAPSPRPMADVEKEKIQEALESCRGNITHAARLLGFRSRQTMLNKMDAYGIPRTYGDLPGDAHSPPDR